MSRWTKSDYLLAAGTARMRAFRNPRGHVLVAGGTGAHRRHFAPASLTAHSLMDGLGIDCTIHMDTDFASAQAALADKMAFLKKHLGVTDRP